MKKNCWLILGMLVATGAVAQNNTNTLPPIPAPIITPAAAPTEPAAPAVAPAAEPVKKAAPAKHKKVAPKKVALNEPTVALVPGAAEVAAPNLNVRGQAGLKGETIAHLKQGEVVAVLSQINLDKHAVGEPAQWAKIALPASTHVWVHTSFIDSATKTVVPKKLNLRAGPGENFSVLGVIEHGTAVKEITTKGAWTEIEPPETACGFVAAMYLKQVPPTAPVASATPPAEPAPAPMVAPTPTPVPEAAPIVTEPAPPSAPPVAPPSALVAAGGTPGQPSIVDQNGTAAVDTNPPPLRIVSHEGVVGHVNSIIAPTAYVLYDPTTSKEINYLHTTSKQLDISRYEGMRVVVTGEEGLAARWNETPVLLIQRIVVLETNVLPKVYYPTPRQRH